MLKGPTPFTSFPFLEHADAGVVISQAPAVLRYVGKLTGLYPSDAAIAARVDELEAMVGADNHGIDSFSLI